jgi:voltage-gated potassium channel
MFAAEYAARVWTAVENPRYGPGWRGRLRYMLSLTALIDLFAIVISFATPAGLSPFALRTFRILRILRLAKLGRLSSAMSYLIEAIQARSYELLFSLIIGLSVLVLSATALYLVEGPIQPAKFGSIPRAMWWATATLTTIGYGDVYPVTPLGKLLAAITAIAGIGLIALPTGILAAAFSEAVQKHSIYFNDNRRKKGRRSVRLDG